MASGSKLNREGHQPAQAANTLFPAPPTSLGVIQPTSLTWILPTVPVWVLRMRDLQF